MSASISTTRPKSAKYRTRPPPKQLPQQQHHFPNDSSSPTKKNPQSSNQTDANPLPITGIGKGPPTIVDNCGGVQVVTWKGGGYNMTMRNTKGKRDGDASKVQDAYVSGLIQQIKLLELEITYLKQHSSAGRGDGTTSSQISPKKLSSSLSPTKDPLSIANVEVSKKISSGSLKGDVQSQDHAEMAVLRKELSDRSARLEDALAVNAKLTSRLKMTEGKSVGDLDERSRRQLDKIAGLTTKCEQQEADCHVIEARYKDTIDLLEKQTITSRNRDHKIEQLNDEIETKDDQMKTTKDELETAKIEFSHLEKQMLDLQDKFMESSVHVMEETINGLGNENRILQQKLKEVQMGLEMEKEQKDRVELRCNKFITENADLASNLAEVKQRLDSEVRVRESRDARLILDTQELAASRERERQLRQDMAKVQTDLDKERIKNKTITEKVSRDNQQITSLELKMATLKSRVSELEGSLNFAQENTNKVRKQALMDQEKLVTIMKELEASREECGNLATKLASGEARVQDAERRTEALATLQSHRWMEFSKMADNMKELSGTMLMQSKTNTRKAAIRADLDEELDL